jgi:sugar O-acyltransferase (sialic acid O-acetyltransferase NeuD family)
MDVKQCVMLGIGGHAAVLLDSINARKDIVLRFGLDISPVKWGKTFCGLLVKGGDNLLGGLIQEGITHFIVGLGANGDNSHRRRLFDFALSHRLQPLSIIHPSTICSIHASLGQGVQILVGAIVNSGASLGRNVIVNTGAIVEHDCRVEDHVHIATGARLGGGVTVHEEAFIGMGASVCPGITIGKRAIVGGGAVVLKDVSDRVTVVGVPARPLDRSRRSANCLSRAVADLVSH